jgi:RNA polymerase-binding transcription factor DksA
MACFFGGDVGHCDECGDPLGLEILLARALWEHEERRK